MAQADANSPQGRGDFNRRQLCSETAGPSGPRNLFDDNRQAGRFVRLPNEIFCALVADL
jgi:hypothetical protein